MHKTPVKKSWDKRRIFISDDKEEEKRTRYKYVCNIQLEQHFVNYREISTTCIQSKVYQSQDFRAKVHV